jgi:hypothetical protein
MLDELIIAEIVRREQEKRLEERPFLELPIPEYSVEDKEEEVPEPKRVIIIDLL